MFKNLKKRTEGFTIVEVMIVLAIAGLIMLIVFLAIPALQRNSRNTQRKTDVAAVLGAINEWSSNNSGALPTAAQVPTALTNAKLSIFNGVVPGTAGGAAATPDAYNIALNAKCSGAAPGTAAANRSVAVLFKVETGGNGTADQCQDS